MSVAEAVNAEPTVVHDPAETRRRLKIGLTLLLVSLLLFYFWWSIENSDVEYLLSGERDRDTEPKTVAAHPVTLVCALITSAAAAAAGAGLLRKGALTVVILIVCGAAFILGFLVWAYSDQESAFKAVITNPLPGTFAIATPLVLGALAGCLCERAGVINVAIEGQFLAGAFFASVVASLTYSAGAGLLGGMAAGVGIAAMLALFSIRYLVNQVVLGVVLVVFASGLTAFLLDQIPGDPKIKAYLNDPPKLEDIAIPGLSKLPIVGEAMFNQTILVYLMYASVVAVTFIMFETRWGLRVRAVGEHPKAADTVGINVRRMRWQAVLFAGLFAGLGGAYFTVGSTGSFDKDASSGNGFIALAAVIMGRWHPVYATFAALFFGFMSSLQDQLKLVNKIPSELLTMTPYIATVVAVAGFVGRVRPPAADGEPYTKG
ncbi:MAG: ABC transporter permease [Propionibacteriales bacterium]|nr:ABC transporter permease [Propionibacteriales bacterium]